MSINLTQTNKAIRILIIEDETHKLEELLKIINELKLPLPDVACSVKDAINQIEEKEYDLLVLDMALPTFGDNSSIQGSDQSEGGIEIIRHLDYIKKTPSILIVTQYYNFHIDGKPIKLNKASKYLREKYNQKIEDSLIFNYKDKSTQIKIKNKLKTIYESIIN